MSGVHHGGCLCGEARYEVSVPPLRVTVCHCTFCQRFTGSAFLVEPIFRKSDVTLTGAALKTYDHRSDESHQRVTVNFCGRCATSLYLSFERFPDVLGLCAGTFDDPNWFERRPDASRHIFTRSAQHGVVLPAGVEIYREHAMRLDGTANTPMVLEQARVVGEGE